MSSLFLFAVLEKEVDFAPIQSDEWHTKTEGGTSMGHSTKSGRSVAEMAPAPRDDTTRLPRTRVYYGMAAENQRAMYATVTGQMDDGTLVYTEVEQNADGSIVIERGEPKLILDNQFTRQLRRGTQTFERL